MPESKKKPPTELFEGLPFRVIGLLGSGASGEVYEAEHTKLRRIVVVKVLRLEYAAREDLADRFRLEGQSLASLDHPNIIRIFDLGCTNGGQPYIVMERLRGRTVAEELKEHGAFPPEQAVAILRQVLAGLSEAHGLGIVHRDLKPENLFVCDPVQGKRVVKILDFGIAKVLPSADAKRAPAPVAVPTTDQIMGTPRYLSPEQARGQAVDHRTDIYAAGGVLYALLTGRGPFAQHKQILPLLNAHANEPPEPPSAQTNQPIPARLDRAALRALAKRPEERFPSAEAFAAELAECLEPEATKWARTERIAAIKPGSHAPADAPAQKPTRRASGTEPIDATAFRAMAAGDASDHVSIAIPEREPRAPSAPTEPIDVSMFQRSASQGAATEPIDASMFQQMAPRAPPIAPPAPESETLAMTVAETRPTPMLRAPASERRTSRLLVGITILLLIAAAAAVLAIVRAGT